MRKHISFTIAATILGLAMGLWLKDSRVKPMPTLLGLTCRRPCQNRTVRSRYSTWFINKSRKESHRHGSSHRQASDRARERRGAA